MTQFGVLSAGTTDEKIAVANALGVTVVRMSVELSSYNNQAIHAFEKFQSAGIDVIMNLNWKDVATVGGNKVPNPFLKSADMTFYRSKITQLLTRYQPLIAVIENEPTTDVFHTGPIEDYITMLENAVDVCHSFGVPVADGAIHPFYILQVMDGGSLSGNALEVQKLITAYANIPNLTHVNMHHGSGGAALTAGMLKSCADFLREQIPGKTIINNEWSMDNALPSLMNSFVEEWVLADVLYSLNYSGGDSGGPVNNGGKLTPLGVVYKDAIANATATNLEVVYDENAESGWAITSVTAGLTVDANDTSHPSHGLKNLNVNGWGSGKTIVFTHTGSLTFADYGTISFDIWLKSALASTANIQIQFYTGSTAVSNRIIIAAAHGLNKKTTGVYQQIKLDIGEFALTSTTFTQVRVSVTGSNPNGFYMDYITLQS